LEAGTETKEGERVRMKAPGEVSEVDEAEEAETLESVIAAGMVPRKVITEDSGPVGVVDAETEHMISLSTWRCDLKQGELKLERGMSGEASLDSQVKESKQRDEAEAELIRWRTSEEVDELADDV
jgi:hypothetical protein